MKFNKIVSLVAGAACLVLSPIAVKAQSDQVAANAPLILANVGTTGSTVLSTTNAPVWLSGYFGRGEIFIMSSTNAGGTVTATFETSPDTTNWTSIPLYSLAANSTQIWTNTYYGSTNLLATNVWVLNYSPTTATASTAGYVSTYAGVTGTLQNTNTGAVTLTKAGLYKIGVSLPTDTYMHVIWNCTGAATNGNTVVGAFLVGPRVTRPGLF